MAIIYTKHAEEMLIFRKLKKVFLEKCVENPDEILPAREGKKTYLKNFGKNYLKLIVSEEGNDIIIVTLYWLAKRRGSK